LVADPRFRTNADRVRNGEALDALIDGFCSQRTRDEVIAIFNRAGCAVGPLETIDSVFENPQIVARGSLARLSDPDLGTVTINNAFPRFVYAGMPSLTPGSSAVGADTAEVLSRELGIDAENMRRLAQDGIIGLATAPGGGPPPEP
jgi:crotonobetainyl-CoA:carnitine CoA-transferase CaiB-like acyl-CoA transferase